MQIIKMGNKIKLQFEYSTSSDDIDFGIISSKELKELFVKVFLKDGSTISQDEIEQITFKAK